MTREVIHTKLTLEFLLCISREQSELLHSYCCFWKRTQAVKVTLAAKDTYIRMYTLLYTVSVQIKVHSWHPCFKVFTSTCTIQCMCTVLPSHQHRVERKMVPWFRDKHTMEERSINKSPRHHSGHHYKNDSPWEGASINLDVHIDLCTNNLYSGAHYHILFLQPAAHYQEICVFTWQHHSIAAETDTHTHIHIE